MATITVEAYQCDSCGHIWLPTGKIPKQCSKCRSRAWNVGLSAKSLADSIPGVALASSLERAVVADEYSQV